MTTIDGRYGPAQQAKGAVRRYDGRDGKDRIGEVLFRYRGCIQALEERCRQCFVRHLPKGIRRRRMNESRPLHQGAVLAAGKQACQDSKEKKCCRFRCHGVAKIKIRPAMAGRILLILYRQIIIPPKDILLK